MIRRIDGSYEEAENYLNAVHPYIDVDIEADHKIRDERYALQIIMPAYNVDRYIEKSIESVLCQKTKYSYVLIIVNDGSTDETGQCLERYRNRDNIKVIHQSNGGAASARNRGLEIMQSKYIMFLDPDDYLCENAIEKLLERAFLLDADIVEGSADSLYKDKYILHKRIHQDSGMKAVDDLWGEPWGKVMKAEIFKKVKFPEKYYFEDTIFSYCIYPVHSKKYTISDCVYVYRRNTAGATIKSKTEIKAIDTYWIMGYMWKRYGYEKSQDAAFQKKTLRHMVLCYKRTEKLGRKITQAGFFYLSGIYLGIFKDSSMLSGKYKQMDNCIRKKQYESFRLLCRWWRFLA